MQIYHSININMSDKFAYIFISIAAFINFIILINGKQYTKCFCNHKKNIKLLVITLCLFYLHYFVHCFGLYGFLFNNKWILGIYIITPIIIVLGWTYFKTEYFKSTCVLTNVTDTLCQLPKNESLDFKELYRTIGIPDITIGNYTTNFAYVVLTWFGYGYVTCKFLHMITH